MNTPFEYLKELCTIRNESNCLTPNLDPITNRVRFITDKLTELGIRYNTTIFNHSYKIDYKQGSDYGKLINIEVDFYSKSNNQLNSANRIIFIAHHDINNPHSENAQDNSASVCNLIKLCEIISKVDSLNRNVSIVFTDNEEFGGYGAGQLGIDIKNGKFGNVDYVVNLELTGVGNNLWCDGVFHDEAKTNLHKHIENIIGVDKISFVQTPFNDSIILRGIGIDSVCIGILPDWDLRQKNTWRLCHSLSDTADKCNAEDMDNFVEFLFKLI